MQYIQHLLSRINLLYLCPFVQKILQLTLALCLVILTPLSAYAAGDSLTSAIALSLNHTKKFQLEAYDHFYAYYTVPSSYSRTKNALSITASSLSMFSISVMNSDGSAISTTKKKNVLYFKKNTFIAGNRYFIKVSNQRNIRSAGSINIQYTTNTATSPKASIKANNNASSRKSRQQGNTKNTSSRKSRQQGNTKNTSSQKADQRKSANNTSSRKSSHPNSTPSQKPKQQKSTNNISFQKFSHRNSTPSQKEKMAAANTSSSSKKRMSSSIKKKQDSSDNSSLSPVTPTVHYIRLKKGTSIALAERIYTTVPNRPLSFTPSSPSLHITDGIVYATSAGLFYIIIRDGSYSTSCTIKVDA